MSCNAAANPHGKPNYPSEPLHGQSFLATEHLPGGEATPSTCRSRVLLPSPPATAGTGVRSRGSWRHIVKP